MRLHNRLNNCRKLAPILLGLGLTLLTLWLPGMWSQCPALASQILAPLPTHTDPSSLELRVPTTASVSIRFDQTIDITSINTRSFAVYGNHSPIFTGTYELSADSKRIILHTARSFFPGERIDAVVTTDTLSTSGEHALSGLTWQFWATVRGGSGYFLDSGQQLGGSNCLDANLGDLDGDGDLDVFVLDYLDGAGNPNQVWINQGGAQAGTPGVFVDSGQALGDSDSYGVALGDLDLDGDLDAFVANDLGDPNRVWVNQGGSQAGSPGVFVDSGQSLGASNSYDVDLGDLDRDGDLDAVVANLNGPNQVWINYGGLQSGASGTFTASQAFGVGNGESARLGDLDGDGDLDVFVANGYYEADTVWLNDGTGALVDTGQRLGAAFSMGVALSDVDGDGDLDAWVAGSDCQVWLNDGQGIFTASGQDFGGSDCSVVELGDMDNDGDIDASIGRNMDQPNEVWRNRGAGVFRDTGQRIGNSDSQAMALGDVDADGDLDIYVGNYSGQENSLWLNRLWWTLLPVVLKPANAL